MALNDIDREIEAARLRVHRLIDRFVARRMNAPSTTMRSIGQIYRRIRERNERKA